MTMDDFLRSIQDEGEPPAGLGLELKALWLAKAGRWDEAHDLTQEMGDPNGAWIHGYLHREEGDLGNAAYWYHRAGRSMPGSGVSLAEEWREMAEELLR